MKRKCKAERSMYERRCTDVGRKRKACVCVTVCVNVCVEEGGRRRGREEGGREEETGAAPKSRVKVKPWETAAASSCHPRQNCERGSPPRRLFHGVWGRNGRLVRSEEEEDRKTRFFFILYWWYFIRDECLFCIFSSVFFRLYYLFSFSFGRFP